MIENKNDRVEYAREYAENQLVRANHPLRRLVKNLYVNRVISKVVGPTIDFGCGAGQILQKLPAGSVGLEINKSLIEALRARGLNAQFYDAFADDFSLSIFSKGQFKSLVLSHVLEHFTNSEELMRKLWHTARKLDLERIVVVVPGSIGYASDVTHRTFIDAKWIKENQLDTISDFKLGTIDYFPVNKESFGDKFIYNEMRLVYSR